MTGRVGHADECGKEASDLVPGEPDQPGWGWGLVGGQDGEDGMGDHGQHGPAVPGGLGLDLVLV